MFLHRYLITTIPLITLLISTATFTTHAQVHLVGSAAEVEMNKYRLTRKIASTAGAVWCKEKINLENAFQVSFELFLGCHKQSSDGVAFVFQNEGKNALGKVGSGMGYKGIKKSVVVEFDNYLNMFESYFPSQELHVAIQKNGDVDHASSNNLAGPNSANPSRMGIKRPCKIYDVSIRWEPGPQLLEVFIDDNFVIAYSGDLINNIFKGQSKVYWGFTAGTNATDFNEQGIRIKQPPLIVDIEKQNVMCPNGNDGAIVVNVEGGIGRYYYKWSNGSTNPNVNRLSAGTYELTVSDSWGNYSIESITIREPQRLQLSKSEILPQDSWYAWNITAKGGQAPLTYRRGYAVVRGTRSIMVDENKLYNSGAQFVLQDKQNINDVINQASLQNPITIVGFVEVSDKNNCVTNFYLPETVRSFPPEQIILNSLSPKTEDEIELPDNTETIDIPQDVAIIPMGIEALDNTTITYNERNKPAKLNERKIKEGKRVIVRGTNLQLSLWDDGDVDGDIVSVFFNGKWVVQNYTLKRRKKVVNINIDPNGDNYLILYAHNEGLRPPNTAALSVRDGRTKKRLALSSSLKFCDAIDFNIYK